MFHLLAQKTGRMMCTQKEMISLLGFIFSLYIGSQSIALKCVTWSVRDEAETISDRLSVIFIDSRYIWPYDTSTILYLALTWYIHRMLTENTSPFYFSVTFPFLFQTLPYNCVIHCTESSQRLSSIQLTRRSTVGQRCLKGIANILGTVRFHSGFYNRHLWEHDCVIDCCLCWQVKSCLLHCYMHTKLTQLVGSLYLFNQFFYWIWTEKISLGR